MNAGEVVMLNQKFKKEDVITEVGKARRKGYTTFYCSWNVYHTLNTGTQVNPYDQKMLVTVMGLKILPIDNFWDNILVFSKMEIYKNNMPCAVQG